MPIVYFHAAAAASAANETEEIEIENGREGWVRRGKA